MEKTYKFKKGDMSLDSNLITFELLDHFCDNTHYDHVEFYGDASMVKVHILRDFTITVKIEDNEK